MGEERGRGKGGEKRRFRRNPTLIVNLGYSMLKIINFISKCA
jgi:hypothetical protein